MSSTLEVRHPPKEDLPEVAVSTEKEAIPRPPDHEGLQVVQPPAVASPAVGDARSPDSEGLQVVKPPFLSSPKSALGGLFGFRRSPDHEGLQVDKPAGKILGLRRRLFWLLLLLLVAVVVAAVLGGVLGTTLRDRNSASASTNESTSSSIATGPQTSSSSSSPPSGSPTSSSGPESSSSSSSSSPSTSSPTSSSTRTSASPSPTIDPGAIQCPEDDSLQYETEDRRLWRVNCGRSFGQSPEAVSIRRIVTLNFEECIRQCGQQNGDPGACIGVDFVRANRTCSFFTEYGGVTLTNGVDSAANLP